MTTLTPERIADLVKELQRTANDFASSGFNVWAKLWREAASALSTPPPAEGVTPGKVEMEFVPGNLPECKAGDMLMCLALVRAKIDGKARVIPAYYLNAHPLEYQDTCEERGCPKNENHDDGCPTTGWFYDESNFEYDNCYHPISGEVLAWARLPKGEMVEAALASKPIAGVEVRGLDPRLGAGNPEALKYSLGDQPTPHSRGG